MNPRILICTIIASISFIALVSGCQQAREMGGLAERAVDLLTGKTPRVAAVKMEDQYFPDERRQGINELAERTFGKQAPYTGRYAQIAQGDSDFLVRATAIRALNRSRDTSATPIFIRALDDREELVRLEACKALTNLPDAGAQPALVRLVGSATEPRDVRIAAADALRNYKSLEVARTLIAQLSGREFGLAWQSRHSLKNLTGKDLRYDENAWLNFITGPTKPFG